MSHFKTWLKQTFCRHDYKREPIFSLWYCTWSCTKCGKQIEATLAGDRLR